MRKFIPAILAVLVLAGCATQTPVATEKKQKADDEYVTVQDTGSRIPKRVKKSDLAAGQNPSTTNTQSMTGEQLGNAVRPGHKVDTGSN